MESILTDARETQDRAGKIRTFTGRYVNPLEMLPADLNIIDIAHHLSLLCRYTGACPEFYSVGQHSISVARRADPARMNPGLRLAALLHDAAEAYLNDIASPVKQSEVFAEYRVIERDLLEVIWDWAGVPFEITETHVKPFDVEQFHAEVASFYGGKSDDITCWPPHLAETLFLDEFRDAQRQLKEMSR